MMPELHNTSKARCAELQLTTLRGIWRAMIAVVRPKRCTVFVSLQIDTVSRCDVAGRSVCVCGLRTEDCGPQRFDDPLTVRDRDVSDADCGLLIQYLPFACAIAKLRRLE